MVGSALIMLREGLEAALIVAIVLAYLRKLGRRDAFGAIWLGAGLAAAVAIVVGTGLFLTIGELEGDARRLTFAIIMVLAASVLTWMIFWMRRQARGIATALHQRVDVALTAGSVGALIGVVFFAMLREGIETALFFVAAAGNSSAVESIVGGALGLAVALVLAWGVYQGASWMNLRQFFAVSGAIVLLFAAGLAARALADLQILGYIPTFWYPVFDFTSVAGVSTDHLLGQLLRGLFGWDPAPSIEQLGIWLGYLIVIGTLYFRGLRPRVPSRA